MNLNQKIRQTGSLALITAIALGSLPQDRANSTHSLSTVTYSASSENILNPERGFKYNIGLVEDPTLAYVRLNGFTVARAYVQLDEFRNKPISDAFLQKLRAGFQRVRSSGFKVILRFAYNLPDDVPDSGAPDAPIDLVLRHIEQLKPILYENADVILVLQQGFIGAWGEGHSSQNNLDSKENRYRITRALLGALPSHRSIQLRTPEYVRDVFPFDLSENNAFTGSYQARTGVHNDCFLANSHDAGTYLPDISRTKAYLARISKWAPVGGDTCQISFPQQRTDCVTTQNELAMFHWTYLSATWYQGNIDRWKREGCYNTIAQKLGYRLQLTSSTLPTKVKPGGIFSGSFKVKNVGYASPINRRALQVVLRHQSTGKLYRASILKLFSRNNDPRWWLPESGEIAVNVEAGIPGNAPTGTYQVFLNLPDPISTLRNNPLYSIRFANNNTWESQTGFNSLLRTVQISSAETGTSYTGSNWFN